MALRAYSRGVKNPSVLTLSSPAPPSEPTRRRRGLPAADEQARRQAWGRDMGYRVKVEMQRAKGNE